MRDWHDEQAKEVKRLRDAAREATSAHAAADVASRRATELPMPRAETVRQAETVGLDGGDVLRRLEEYQKALAAIDLDQLAAGIEKTAGPLRAAVAELRAKAAAEVQRREDAWRPLASQIHAWLPIAREARDGADAIKPLKAAEAWLKDTVADAPHRAVRAHQGEVPGHLDPAPPAEQRRAGGHPPLRLRHAARGRAERDRGRRRRRRPRRDEPGRAARFGSVFVHPAGDAGRIAVPVHRHRRSRPVDGPLARGRPGPRARVRGARPPGGRLHPRRPPARGRAPDGHRRHRAGGDAARVVGGRGLEGPGPGEAPYR